MRRFFSPRYHGQFMRSPMFTALAFLLLGGFLSGCSSDKKPDFTVKLLIGGTTIPAADEAPIEDSVIVISGSKIRSVGPRNDVTVPQASDRTDLAGEWIVPPQGSRIEAGGPANLLILKHAPNGITPANPGDVGAQLVAGDWKLPDTK